MKPLYHVNLSLSPVFFAYTLLNVPNECSSLDNDPYSRANTQVCTVDAHSAAVSCSTLLRSRTSYQRSSNRPTETPRRRRGDAATFEVFEVPRVLNVQIINNNTLTGHTAADISQAVGNSIFVRLFCSKLFIKHAV